MIATVLYRLATVLSVLWIGAAGFVVLSHPNTKVVTIRVEDKPFTMRVPPGVTETAVEEFAKAQIEQWRKDKERGGLTGKFAGELLRRFEASDRWEQKWEPSPIERVTVFTEPRILLMAFGPPVVLFLLVATVTWIFAPLGNFSRDSENRHRG